ncbi:MAG TPA: beta-hydroxyacyl-ACP dehydratase [Micromonosporaceae bacterium]|nr:beta-hydroxyacyl-ACP dehydratase [Micromonosporaceae bacterium]
MIDAAGIKELIPHRYPMLLVDRVVEVVPGESLVAVKAVTANEPWFDAPWYSGAVVDVADHAYPPVLLLESWCQAAGVLVSLDSPNPDVQTGRVTLFGGLRDVRFLGRARPGELLWHRVRLVRAVSDGAVVEGESVAGSGTVLQVGRVVVALRPAVSVREEAVDAR